MKEMKSGLDVRASGRDITLTNGVVQLKLVFCDGGYAQEFYGLDRCGRPRLILSTLHRDLIPFTEHRVTADPIISGHRRHLFEVTRESIRMVYSDARVTRDDRQLSVKLSGRFAESEVTSTITLPVGSKSVRVSVDVELAASRRPPILEYLMSIYAFLPDGMLLDHYKRLTYAWAPALRPQDDQIIGERSFRTAATVVQYKKLLAALVPDPDVARHFPAALDLDLRNGLLPAPVLAYGFCRSEAEGPFSYHDRSMLLRPQAGTLSYSFNLYLDADATLAEDLRSVQELVWSRARARVAEREPPETQIGLSDDPASAYVLKSGPHSAADSYRAEEIIQQVLARQLPEGVFAPETGLADPGPYDTTLTSEMCRWMLAIHRDCEPDLRVLLACRNYGDFLVANQFPSGAIPSWFSDRFIPLPDLRESAQTAASGRFLAELYELTGHKSYLTAACRAASLVSNLVIKQRYHEREAFLSGALGIQDPHTGILPQSSISMRQAADLFLAVYRLTGKRCYLKSGVAALTQMCWLQDTWSAETGAFGAGNASQAEVPQAQFARTLLEYYEATRHTEYIERGIAALHSGLAPGSPEALAVQRWATRRFGAALVDVVARSAYAIGPCRITGLSLGPSKLSLELHNGFAHDSYPLRVRFCGLRKNSYRVAINGEEKRYSKVELETGVEIRRIVFA
ncbi:MAG: hypothetical protein HYX78_03815 [Armatimonadetes bacterium]|nr:hypothetical protein [Armatimonadota bacterium]